MNLFQIWPQGGVTNKSGTQLYDIALHRVTKLLIYKYLSTFVCPTQLDFIKNLLCKFFQQIGSGGKWIIIVKDFKISLLPTQIRYKSPCDSRPIMWGKFPEIQFSLKSLLCAAPGRNPLGRPACQGTQRAWSYRVSAPVGTNKGMKWCKNIIFSSE